MCSPAAAIPMVSAGINAISTAVQINAQNQQADAEMKSAYDAAAMDFMALQEQALQSQQSYNIEIFERQKQALRERSKLVAAAGEAGIAANSRSLLREISQTMFDASYDTGIQKQNAQNSLFQNQLQMQSVWANRESRLNSAKAKKSNPFLSALMIGSGLAGGIIEMNSVRSGR